MSNITPSERKKIENSDKKRMQLKEKLKMERERHEHVLLKLQKEFVKKKSADDELHLSKIKSIQEDIGENSAEILKILSKNESTQDNKELLNTDNVNKDTIQ